MDAKAKNHGNALTRAQAMNKIRNFRVDKQKYKRLLQNNTIVDLALSFGYALL